MSFLLSAILPETYGYDFFLESMRWMPYILRVDFEGEKVVRNRMEGYLVR